MATTDAMSSSEIPILPRRISSFPSSTEVTGNAEPYNYGFPTHPAQMPYGTGVTFYPFNSIHTVSNAIENLLQLLYSWTNMIDGTYYTWTTTLSLAASLWDRILEISMKSRKLSLAIIRKLFLFFRSENGIPFDKTIFTQHPHFLKKSLGIFGAFALITVAILISFLKRNHLFSEVKEEEEDTTLFGKEDCKFVKLSHPVFAKVLYEFKSSDSGDLPVLTKGQLVAITQVPESHTNIQADGIVVGLDKALLESDPTWFYGRTRNGTYGLFPSNYISIIETPSSA